MAPFHGRRASQQKRRPCTTVAFPFGYWIAWRSAMRGITLPDETSTMRSECGWISVGPSSSTHRQECSLVQYRRNMAYFVVPKFSLRMQVQPAHWGPCDSPIALSGLRFLAERTCQHRAEYRSDQHEWQVKRSYKEGEFFTSKIQ